jgi:hypothetical protein
MKPTGHRILYTGDCNYLFANDYRRPENRSGPYTASVLDEHAQLLAESGIDTHLINPNGQVPWQPSKALPSMIEGYTRGDRDFVRPHYPALDENFKQKQLDERLGGLLGGGMPGARHLAMGFDSNERRARGKQLGRVLFQLRASERPSLPVERDKDGSQAGRQSVLPSLQLRTPGGARLLLRTD